MQLTTKPFLSILKITLLKKSENHFCSKPNQHTQALNTLQEYIWRHANLQPVEKAYATTMGRIYYSEGWWAQNLVGISYHWAGEVEWDQEVFVQGDPHQPGEGRVLHPGGSVGLPSLACMVDHNLGAFAAKKKVYSNILPVYLDKYIFYIFNSLMNKI